MKNGPKGGKDGPEEYVEQDPGTSLKTHHRQPRTTGPCRHKLLDSKAKKGGGLSSAYNGCGPTGSYYVSFLFHLLFPCYDFVSRPRDLVPNSRVVISVQPVLLANTPRQDTQHPMNRRGDRRWVTFDRRRESMLVCTDVRNGLQGNHRFLGGLLLTRSA